MMVLMCLVSVCWFAGSPTAADQRLWSSGNWISTPSIRRLPPSRLSALSWEKPAPSCPPYEAATSSSWPTWSNQWSHPELFSWGATLGSGPICSRSSPAPRSRLIGRSSRWSACTSGPGCLTADGWQWRSCLMDLCRRWPTVCSGCCCSRSGGKKLWRYKSNQLDLKSNFTKKRFERIFIFWSKFKL